MVIHSRNEYEKELTKAIYEKLKERGFSKIGYAMKDMNLKKFNLFVKQGDLIILAEDPIQNLLLLGIYLKILESENKNFPEVKYVNKLTIAFADTFRYSG